MFALTKVVQTFPSAQIPSQSGGLPVEVSLIAQLGHGSGNHLFQSVLARQKAHQTFIDELDEPSARLGGTDFDKGDPTSLYSFVVGAKGHPFHRHAGHRIFTAVSGSGGAQLRFSSASMSQIEADPSSFVRALQYIDIPPDCLFTVRFGGETWHQFAPLARNSLHPAFFALSCHTNELGGALPEELKERVLAGEATIPALTELLPQSVLDLLHDQALDPADIPTVTLSLDAPPGTLQNAMCKTARGSAGLIRGTWAKWARSSGFTSDNGGGRKVLELERPPQGSLLLDQFRGESPFWGWLRQIVVNEALMRLRKRRLNYVDELPEPEALLGVVTERLDTQDLERAMAELTPLTRSVVWLYYVEGYTHEEIAGAFDKSVSFSKSQILRGTQKLRSLLDAGKEQMNYGIA